jgi:endonuclease/exonuclease/phosphatase family metal-dependent hydrolase
MKAIRHTVGWLLKALSLLAAAGLVFAYSARYISPADTWLFAFFGLLFPQWVVANLVLFVCWAAAKRKMGWVHLAVLIPAFFFLPAYVQWRGHTTEAPVADSVRPLKIMTYNVHLFRVNTYSKTLETLPDIAAFVEKEAPAIVCFQEAAVFDTTVIKRTFAQYPYIHFQSREMFGNARFTTVTLSRYPMVNKAVIIFPNSGNVCIYTDISIDGQTVRVYNNHLESTRLNLAMSFSRLKKDKSRNEEIKLVTTRLRDAFQKRATQVDTVAAHIATSPYPVLVCGDFNDLPMSYTYRKMKGPRHDTFIEAGAGLPSTFRSQLPAFRIDYIFSDSFFTTTGFAIPEVTYSDHYPVVATLTYQTKAKAGND